MSYAENCLLYLQDLYHGSRIHHEQTNIAHTYGEILPESIHKLLQLIDPRAEDSFLDLGSGLGKVVLQVMLQTPVKIAIGIEIIEALHQQAIAVAAKIQLSQCRSIQLIHADFLNTPLPEASIVLIGSPCFTPQDLRKIASRLDVMAPLHTIFSLRPLPPLKRLRFNKVLRVECTWDSAQCYVYRSNYS